MIRCSFDNIFGVEGFGRIMQGRTHGDREYDDCDDEVEDKNSIPHSEQRGEILERRQADRLGGWQDSDSEEECRGDKSQHREMND